mmetsp:Transcript_23429/g.60880  ORF Transcript_23429/g.60880 Transcript_23429/m.60880 type:complete len:418 (-) Transcript_23429:13-1266(-)
MPRRFPEPGSVALLLPLLGLSTLLVGGAPLSPDGAGGEGSLPPCYGRGGRGSLSREVPAELHAPDRCEREQQGGIRYRLHTRRYPMCQRQCPASLRPSGCSLSRLSAGRFICELNGRRLVLWGDSVSRMHFDFLARVLLQGCTQRRLQFVPKASRRGSRAPGAAVRLRGYSLQVLGASGGAVLTKTQACQPLPPEEHGAPSCVRVRGCEPGGPAATADICYIHSFKEAVGAGSQPCLAHLRPSDVVLFNTGLHFQPTERRSYARSLRALSSAWAALASGAAQRGQPAPEAIWRETSPQHFDTPGGEFAFRRVVRSRGYSCSAVARREAEEHNWRNRVAEQELLPRMPLLRVWNVSLGAPHLHTQFRAKPGGETYADCSHYCISPRGMYFAWTELLLNQLMALLPRGGLAGGQQPPAA